MPRAPAEQGKRRGISPSSRRGMRVGFILIFFSPSLLLLCFVVFFFVFFWRDRVIHASLTDASCEGGESCRLAPGGMRCRGRRGAPGTTRSGRVVPAPAPTPTPAPRASGGRLGNVFFSPAAWISARENRVALTPESFGNRGLCFCSFGAAKRGGG